jgi:uncharacterized membrane protein
MSENKEKTFQIRFNTQSKDASDKWRLIHEGDETLVSDIVIDAKTYTTKNHIDGVGDKWHITCTGVLDVDDGVAHIRVKKPDNSIHRHLYKTISYRILGTTVTVFTAYILGAPVELSMIIGAGELILKPILYFLHERLWFKFR